jgi:hypothetical protein
MGCPSTSSYCTIRPYNPEDEAEKRLAREYAESLRAALAADRRGDALELFFGLVGMPQEMIDGLRQSPRWAELETLAHTLAYDSEVMGDMSTGGAIPRDLLTRVTPLALVLVGQQSPEFMIGIGRQIADALPHGRLHLLAGEEHVVAPGVLAPVLADFLSEGWRGESGRSTSRSSMAWPPACSRPACTYGAASPAAPWPSSSAFAPRS